MLKCDILIQHYNTNVILKFSKHIKASYSFLHYAMGQYVKGHCWNFNTLNVCKTHILFILTKNRRPRIKKNLLNMKCEFHSLLIASAKALFVPINI
jgi:hypothetical protein